MYLYQDGLHLLIKQIFEAKCIKRGSDFVQENKQMLRMKNLIENTQRNNLTCSSVPLIGYLDISSFYIKIMNKKEVLKRIN